MTKNEPKALFMTRRQLAVRWQCSIETLKRREKAGLLPFSKLGRDVRYKLTNICKIEKDAELSL